MTAAHRRFILFFIISFLLANTSFSQTLKGTVLQKSFTGPITGKTVYYNIYLPDGYNEPATKYPVVYMLHGWTQDRGGTQNTIVPQSFENAVDSGIIGKFIIVFAEGYNDSFWGDSKDGSKPAETNIVKELIPHIDATYRTLADRKNRVVQGFSMGGFGAAKFISKYPDLFSVAILYDAAILKWNEMKLVFPNIASGVYGNDENYFNQYSPWYWTPLNASKMKDSVRIRFVVGYYPSLNSPYKNLLNSNLITNEYVETGCPHDLNCLLSKEGLNSAKFISQSIPATYSISGKVTYANSSNSPMPFLQMNLLGSYLDHIQSYILYTNEYGEYLYNNLPNGTYYISNISSFLGKQDFNGVNSTDALQIRKYLVDASSLDSMQMAAADINGDKRVTSTDALLLRKSIAGIDSSYAIGNYILNQTGIQIFGSNAVNNIKVIKKGDVNSSYTPLVPISAKKEEKP